MDKSAGNKLYRAHEFSEMARISVRTLHYYDQIGLVKAKRNGAGYRLYEARDLERLEQILALKFLGVPLKQIKTFLKREPPAFADALSMQRRILEEKRRMLDSAILAIGEAEMVLRRGESPDAAILKKIIEVIEMQSDTQWADKYYTPEARAKIEERKKLWSPELQERVSAEWSQLFRDIENALDEDPASEKAQALAQRWSKLVEGFTGADPEIATGLNNLYKDRANWPEHARKMMEPYSNPRVWEFMGKAMAARKG